MLLFFTDHASQRVGGLHVASLELDELLLHMRKNHSFDGDGGRCNCITAKYARCGSE